MRSERVARGRGVAHWFLFAAVALVVLGWWAAAPRRAVPAVVGAHAARAATGAKGDANLSAGVVFGDGVRCAGGALKRRAAKNASGGDVSFPTAGEPSITARSAALGDPIAAGSSRFDQTYYRDPSASFCPSATFNATGAIQIDW